LLALLNWYQHIRIQFISDEFPEQLFEGVLDKIDLAVKERIKRLEAFVIKSSEFKLASEKLKKQNQILAQQWPVIKDLLNSYRKTGGDDQLKDNFIGIIQNILKTHEDNYLKTIINLTPENQSLGTQWLQGIVDQVVNEINNQVEGRRLKVEGRR
jgi:bifunctional UDP-N-acetylglucosamine pyrophosphorylase/glucosamine-1-phosphate N-acetyltransferase